MSEKRQKVSRKDFLKNILASWYLILFASGMCALFSYLLISLTVSVINERIEIAEKASVYEIVEGKVESVEVHKYYSEERAGHPPDIIPDKKYEADVSYTDKNGTIHQLRTSEVDKKLTVGKKVKVAYNPADEKDADIAYFDVLVLTYMPCYMNTFRLSYISSFIIFLLMVILFVYLLCTTIQECAQEPYKPSKRKNVSCNNRKKSLSRQQLRARRNLYTIAGCTAVPLCVIWHYKYLTGKEVVVLSELDVFMKEWAVSWKHIAIACVAYLPVIVFFGLRAYYEGRRLKARKEEN